MHGISSHGMPKGEYPWSVRLVHRPIKTLRSGVALRPIVQVYYPARDTLVDETSDERRQIWREMVENAILTMNSKNKHGQLSVALGQSVYPILWSLMSWLTESLTNLAIPTLAGINSAKH